MPTLSPDTSSDAERVQIQLLRQMPPSRKLELVAQLNQTVRTLTLEGLRQRYPSAQPAELKRRLAELWLGAALAERVYGLPPRQEEAA